MPRSRSSSPPPPTSPAPCSSSTAGSLCATHECAGPRRVVSPEREGIASQRGFSAARHPHEQGGVMGPKLTAVLLIVAAVLANVAFTALGSIFDYPDVLDEPAGAVLASFREHETAVSAWFSVLALSAALLAPIAVGVARLSSKRVMRIAMWIGTAAAVVRVVGLLRWPILVPGYASDAASAAPVVAAGARDSFSTASDVLGTAIGETLGYLLTATWTVLVIVALGRRFGRRWVCVRGAAAAC